MNKPKIFPIKLYCSDNGYCTHTPQLANLVWRRLQQGRRWYTASVVLLEEGKLKLQVHDIADNFHGGIGDVLYELDACVETEKEVELYNLEVKKRVQDLAEELLEKRAREKQAHLLKLTIERVFGNEGLVNKT